MDTVQLPAPDPRFDRAATHATTDKLPPSHHPMLPLRKVGQQPIHPASVVFSVPGT